MITYAPCHLIFLILLKWQAGLVPISTNGPLLPAKAGITEILVASRFNLAGKGRLGTFYCFCFVCNHLEIAVELHQSAFAN